MFIQRRRRFSQSAAHTVSGGGGGAYQGPGDVIASDWVWWVGMRAFSAATIGNNLIKIHSTDDPVHSGVTTSTGSSNFASQASGFLDYSAISTLKGSNFACAETLYDQVSTHNATNATLLQRPGVTLTSPFGINLSFRDSDSTVLDLDVTLAGAVSPPFTIYAVVLSASHSNFQSVIHDGTNAIGVGSDQHVYGSWNGINHGTGTISDSTKYVIAAVSGTGGGSNTQHYINGSTDGSAVANGTNNFGASFTVGATPGEAVPWLTSGTIQEIGILTGDHGSDMAALSSNCRDATVGWNF